MRQGELMLPKELTDFDGGGKYVLQVRQFGHDNFVKVEKIETVTLENGRKQQRVYVR